MERIHLDLELPLSSFTLEVREDLERPATALFGPSGAGKTSLLEAIAGLRPARGEARIGSRVLLSSRGRIDRRPEERGIGYVPQEGALFPHLSARKNILYGRRRLLAARRTGPLWSLAHVAEALEISGLLDRSPARLSGGERQRVALARALLSGPDLLLLDEPLAAVHTELRERIIPCLARIREEFSVPILYVTHDPAEVLALADWVLFLDRGRVVASGLPREVLLSRARIERSLAGGIENVFTGKVEGSDAARGTTTVRVAGRTLSVPYAARAPGTEVRVGIAAEEILLAASRPESISAQNVIEGKIERIEEMGGTAVVRVLSGEEYLSRLTASAAERMGLAAGQTVYLVIKAHSIHVRP